MANRHSALTPHYPRGLHGRPGEPGVQLQEITGLNLRQVAAWPETVQSVGATLASAIGIAKAPGPGLAMSGTQATALRVEPLKWWLLDGSALSLDPEVGTSLDLSHSRTRVLVTGPDAGLCLSRLLPIDLREKSFSIGHVASSGVHHVGVTLWRSHRGYELFIPRGFALSIWELLLETAEQFGSEVR